MPAIYTFDVFSTLDGFGSYEGREWGGYWSKQGPEFLEGRLALYSHPHRMLFGANTFRQMVSLIGPETGMVRDLDPVNTALRNIPTTVVSKTLSGPLDWPDVTVAAEDAVALVTRLKQESDVPLLSHGSLSLNRSLLAAGLVDQIRLTIFPVLSGQSGIEPVFAGVEDFDLQLIKAETLDGGTQQLTYRPTLLA